MKKRIGRRVILLIILTVNIFLIPVLVIYAVSQRKAELSTSSLQVLPKSMTEYVDILDYADSPRAEENINEKTKRGAFPVLGSTHVVNNQAVVFVNQANIQGMGIDERDLFQEEILENVERVPKYCMIDGKIIADHAYYKNSQLKDVILPDSICEIGEFSFARSSLRNIIIPQGVETIEYGAFYHCDELEMMSLPNSIINISPYAFAHTYLFDSFFTEQTESDFLVSGDILLAYKGTQSTVVIPDGIRLIAACAFKDHSEIEKIIFPDSIEIICEEAFSHCIHLSSVSFGNQIHKIKDNAFKDCNLTSVVIPASLDQLGLQVFDTSTKMEYLGMSPKRSYEKSATRLSKVSTAPGYLQEHCSLSVNPILPSQAIKRAFLRNLSLVLPKDSQCYKLSLMDERNIPIIRLEEETIEVLLPISKELSSRSLKVYQLDNNGQLDNISFHTVKYENTTAVQLKLSSTRSIIIVPQK